MSCQVHTGFSKVARSGTQTGRQGSSPSFSVFLSSFETSLSFLPSSEVASPCFSSSDFLSPSGGVLSSDSSVFLSSSGGVVFLGSSVCLSPPDSTVPSSLSACGAVVEPSSPVFFSSVGSVVTAVLVGLSGSSARAAWGSTAPPNNAAAVAEITGTRAFQVLACFAAPDARRAVP
ncbi:hypothetical protein AAV33_05645 [Corynebacterium otitidis]|nr:hypothetical protein AAV33_05645 [Corynebacterium otitidis]